MKIKVITVFLLSFLVMSIEIYSSEKIIIATVSESEKNENRVDETLIKIIFDELKIKYEIKYFPWNRCIELTESKKIDAMFCLKKTEEREKVIIFPEEGLVDSEWVFFYRKDKNIEYNSCETLKGKVVAATSGYAYGDNFWKNSDYIIDEGYDDAVNMNKVINGRVDYFICNKEDGLKILKKLKNIDVIYSKKVYMSYPLYIGFAMNKENNSIAKKFSKKLSELKKNGKYEKIVENISENLSQEM